MDKRDLAELIERAQAIIRRFQQHPCPKGQRAWEEALDEIATLTADGLNFHAFYLRIRREATGP